MIMFKNKIIRLVVGVLILAVFFNTVINITDIAYALTSKTFETDGDDVVFRGKLDVGKPGTVSGLDVGEGGSYTTDPDGTVVVQAFKYDNSAASGSRFTEFTLTDSNTWLGGVNDRFVVCSVYKFWAVRFNTTTAKSTELIQMSYWNGSASTTMTHMGLLKDSATSTGRQILEQTAQKEYVTFDHEIDDDWAVADNVTNEIPDLTGNMYCVNFTTPTGGFATPPIVSEIKVRGTDFDLVSGLSYPLLWGKARLEKHERIALTIVKSPGGTGTANIDIDSAHQQTVFDFNGAGDNLSFLWTLPEGIDTSSKIEVRLDYSSTAVDTYDIDLTASRLASSTAINNGVTPDFTSSTAITSPAANTLFTSENLTTTRIPIDDLFPNDVISFEIQRTDTTNSFYPMNITIHYVIFGFGEIAGE